MFHITDNYSSGSRELYSCKVLLKKKKVLQDIYKNFEFCNSNILILHVLKHIYCTLYPSSKKTLLQNHTKNIGPWVGFELTTLVVIGTDCIGNYKSNYHTITTTKAPLFVLEYHSWPGWVFSSSINWWQNCFQLVLGC